MKKLLQTLSIILCLVMCVTIFSACAFGSSGDSDNDSETGSVVPIPSEISVSNYESKIVVGEEAFTSLKVQQKIKGEWEDVPKADFTYECNYDGSKYGEYSLKVYLNDYPHIKFEDTITVNPLTVQVPTYTTVYTGSVVDIKAQLEANANGLYTVTKYTKVSNVGKYEASVTLTDPNKYMWVDADSRILRGRTQSVNWDITIAPAKTYSGPSHLTVYYGDTLYDVAADNNLENIVWKDDASTKISNQAYAIAIYNESVGNYQNTPITIFFDEIIRTSEYTIEYYFSDGSEYVIDESMTTILSGNITELVSIESPVIEGFEFDEFRSTIVGKILKRGGLVLQLYYNPA